MDMNAILASSIVNFLCRKSKMSTSFMSFALNNIANSRKINEDSNKYYMYMVPHLSTLSKFLGGGCRVYHPFKWNNSSNNFQNN